jgi:hypothetical protein
MRSAFFHFIYIAVLTLGTLSFGNAPGVAQNLVMNGDFESPPYGVNGTVTNWTVAGNGRVTEAQEGSTSGTHAAGFDGAGDSQGNVLFQTITTVPGRAYIFEFDGGVYGVPSGAAPQIHFQVFGNASQVDETIPLPVLNTFTASSVQFQHFFRPFTADSTSTTIRFTDVGFGNASADTLVDTVSVIVAPLPTPVPTPTTLPLVNGDFEAWPFNDPPTVTGWTVSGNKHIEALNEGAVSPSHSAGFSVGGDSFNNILSQTFNTAASQTYTLDFEAGVFGQRSGAPLQLQAQVLGASPSFAVTVTPIDASTFNPSMVMFAHYHFTFVAGGSTATIQFTDLVGNNAQADLLLDNVSILPLPPTFAQWQASYFTAAQLSDPTVSGWNADPDHDGTPNGLEYYFHTSPIAAPTTAEQSSRPQVGLMSSAGSTYVTFSYRRLLGWSGNPAIVAVSDDLVSWDLSQNQIEQVGTPARVDGFCELVTVRLKTPISQGPIPKKFFQLRLTQ